MKRDFNERSKKNIKKCVKIIISVIIAILGLGTLKLYLNNGDKIQVGENNGVIIGENNGIIKNYTMRGESTKAQNIEEEFEEYIVEYECTYVDSEDSIIKGNSLFLEGIKINNYLYWMEDVSFETAFGTDKINIVFGTDHPVGYKFFAYTDKTGWYLMIDTVACYTTLFDEYDNIKEGVTIQISPYDFDSDGIYELIFCITDGTEGICAVFSYTHVDNIEKINPFKLELCIEIQEIIFLDENSLKVLIGSHGIIDKEYKYIEKQFMVIA